MAHNHSHSFGEQRNKETRTVGMVGAITNLVLSVVKIIVGYIGHSHALVVDGIHSLSDLLSDALVIFASHHANQDPDEEHPYGHGRFETAATLALGILLVLIAVGIGWESIERLINHEEIITPTVITLYAAGFSILANEALYWYTIIVAKKIKSNLLKANAWHHRSDAVSSIVVLLGIVGTQLGVDNLDIIAAILVAAMIAKIGWSLGWQALEELVDKSLEQNEVKKVEEVIEAVNGVVSVHMLRTRKSGHLSAADVHILVDPWLSVSEGHMIAVAVETNLKNKIEHLTDVTVHIDPENDEESPPCEGLPLRNEVIEILKKIWSDDNGNFDLIKISLHYLSGKINIDLKLPLENFESIEKTKKLQKDMNKKLADDERFGAVVISYATRN